MSFCRNFLTGDRKFKYAMLFIGNKDMELLNGAQSSHHIIGWTILVVGFVLVYRFNWMAVIIQVKQGSYYDVVLSLSLFTIAVLGR